MNTTNTELIWKAVTKGKRTRKSIARSINCAAKVGHSPSPSGVGNFSGSDPDLSGESVARESNYGKSNRVPIKKRKHLLQPSSPHTWTPLDYLEHETKDAGDFSGIELLAAAASMEDNADDSKNVDLGVGHSSSLKDSDASRSAAQCKIESKNDDPESYASIMTVNVGNGDHSQALTNSATVSQCPFVKPVDVVIPQLDRHHWDLNTPMDAWVLPCDDSIVGNSSKDMHIDVVKDPSNVAGTVSGQDTEKTTGEMNPDQVLTGGIQKDSSNNVMNTATVVGCFPLREIYWPSCVFKLEEKINATSMTVAMNNSEDCSSNISKADRITSSINQTVTQATHDIPIPACEISETAVNVQCKGIKDQWKDCEPPGSVIQDGKSVLSSDSRIQNDGAYVPCLMADSQGQPTELVIDHGGSELPNEGSRSNELEDSCKSSIVGAQCGDPTSSAGKNGSSVNHNFHVVDKDGLTKYQDEYESPYEDGELRGSFLYSWENNELEDEYVDYESDGRNGQGSEAADHHPENFEGDSGEYFGIQRSDSKKIPESNGSKVGSVKQHPSTLFVKADSINSETSGLGSIEGSGTTFTEPLETNKKYEFKKGRHLTDMRDAKMILMDKYKPEIIKRRLRLQSEGWSSFDPVDRKDVYMQRYRSSFSHPERDITYNGKHLTRYTPSTHSERVGLQHPESWDSRRRCPSKVIGTEGGSYARPKKMSRNLDKMCENDFNDPGQMADYISNQMHRPIMRSPEEGVGYFGMRGDRIPLKRGRDNYRSRGPYRHFGGRDFVEHFESIPDEDNFPVRYLSTKEHSFSPNSGRSAHMSLPCKRPHSKSRARILGAWHPHKEQKIFCTRRHSKFPDFRSEARIVRTRATFPKSSFLSNSREGYISSSSGRISSAQGNCRWVDDGGFENNHSRPNRSPVRAFRHTKIFDDVGYPGQLKSDDCFRPMFRSQRLPFMSSGGREYKLESNYDGKRHKNSDEMMHGGSHPDGNGYVRRFRHNAAIGFETGNLNVANDVDRRNAPQFQGERVGNSP